MSEIRLIKPTDYPELVSIYNYYIENTPITFDLEPYILETRAPWFEQFEVNSRYVCFVAVEDERVLGYANSSRFRPKAAYGTSVESSVYLHPNATGRGLGHRLYEILFDYLAQRQDVHKIYAGVTLPNDASTALHERVGLSRVASLKRLGTSLTSTGTYSGTRSYPNSNRNRIQPPIIISSQ